MGSTSAEATKEPERWQVQVLDIGSAVVAAAAVLWLVGFLDQLSRVQWPAHLVAVACAVAAATRPLPYVLRSLCLCAGAALITATTVFHSGLTPGLLLSSLLLIVVSGLLLGARWALGAWLLSVLIIAAGGYAQVAGLADYDPTAVDPRRPEVSLRYVGTYVLFSSMIAVATSLVVRNVSSTLSDLRNALAEARAAKAEQERAQEAGEQALTQMIEAQKFETIAQLSASIAHDFNNILQVILGHTWSLERKRGEELGASAREITQACADAGKLASQLLTLGQRAVLERRPTDIGVELDNMRPGIERLLPSNIGLEWAMDPGHVVSVDRVQLKQAVLNLVINATHSMTDGGTLSIWVAPRGEGQVELGFRDTGAGMAPEVRRKAFQPFFSTKGERGSGLGMATVQAIVTQHDGLVELESEAGRGTTVRLVLPRSDESLERVTRRPSPEGSLCGCSVLVVDDDPRIRASLDQMMRDAGASVLTARSAEHAIEVARSHAGPIDVVCTDAIMPGAPTRELIQHIEQERPEAKILICSAYVESELLRRGIQTRKYAFIAKPFLPEQLISKIRRLAPDLGDRGSLRGGRSAGSTG